MLMVLDIRSKIVFYPAAMYNFYIPNFADTLRARLPISLNIMKYMSAFPPIWLAGNSCV